MIVAEDDHGPLQRAHRDGSSSLVPNHEDIYTSTGTACRWPVVESWASAASCAWQMKRELVHAPSTPLDQHPGMLYPLCFLIRQSHWEPLGRCWNRFCSDWQMCIGHGIRVAARAFVTFVKGIWNACYYYYYYYYTLVHYWSYLNV